MSENSPNQILLDAFADELEKLGGMQKEAIVGRVAKGLKHAKGWFGPLSLGLTALFLPSTMKGTAKAAQGRSPKHLQMMQNVGRPRQIRGFN